MLPITNQIIKLSSVLYIVFIFSYHVFPQSEFQIKYGGDQKDIGKLVMQASGNDFLILSRTMSYGSGHEDIMINRLDSVGNIKWTKVMGSSNRDVPYFIQPDHDGGYILANWLVHSPGTYDDHYICKIDEEGNILKEKFFGGYLDDELMALRLTQDGGYILAGSTRSYAMYDVDIWTIKLDADWNVSWTLVVDTEIGEHSRDILQFNNGYYVQLGNRRSSVQANQDIVLLGVGPDGNLAWSRSIGDEPNVDGRSMVKTPNNDIIITGFTDSYGAGNNDILVTKVDCSGNVYWAKTYGGAGDDRSFKIASSDQGNYLISGTTTSFGNGGADVIILNINENVDLIRATSFGGELDEYQAYLEPTDDQGYIFSSGTFSYGSQDQDILVVKTDASGNSCCGENIENVLMNNISLSSDIISPNVSSGIEYPSHNITTEIVALTAQTLCYEPVEIIGEDTLCSMEENIKYTVNPKVDIGFIWTLPPGASIVSAQGDTTIFVEFGNQSGYIYLSAMDVCNPGILDSLYVVVSDFKKPFLGNDTVICDFDNVFLNAGSGYTQYLWQDGSTDSTFLATQSGTYWVLVTDAAGCSGGDTISIELGPFIPPDLGTDSTICEGATLVLSPGSDYTSFLWQDGSSEPFFSVSQPGEYWVQVANDCGSGSDTINIESIPGPTVSLGNDTSFCYGHYTTLNAGSGFDSYFWNTGSTDSSITAYLTGNYWVIVTDSNGCTASDTMTISASNAFELDIGNDTAICEEDYIFLNPGNGFSSYLWQDSSTYQTFVADLPGIYWVDVFDSSGCGARDSLVLSNLPSPDPFIGNDTSICLGHTIMLDAGPEFETYVWNDGSQQQYFLADTAGTFWVEVTDSSGCTGRGYIDIAWMDNPLANIPDTTACFGESVRFSPGPDFDEYLWSDGSTDSVLMVQDEGSYWVKVLTSCGEAVDTFALTYYHEMVVRLGNDTSICTDETILLDPGPGFDSYVWQNGDQNQFFEVTERGIYWVQVSNGKCQATDTILIDHCPDITVPNVFTPNGDQHNDYFFAIGENIEQFHLMVFNRWGQLLFETNDINEKWDGKTNGTKCPQGTYFWVIDYRYNSLNGDYADYELKGTVTLIR